MGDGIGARRVSAHIEAEVTDTACVALAVAVADVHVPAVEQLDVTLDGEPVGVREIANDHGGRLHILDDVAPGHLEIDYAATVESPAAAQTASELDTYRYVLPSRYCQSDELGPLARAEFAGMSRDDMLRAISSWVGQNLAYVPGSSRPIDGAVATLLARQGVCRDYAHLAAALLRANGVPARLVSVYAPGLDPMDFHAVTEVCMDRTWHVVDTTCLAPRSSMVRIATGADATDTAFMTTLRGSAELTGIEVSAVVTGDLPTDDIDELVQLR